MTDPSPPGQPTSPPESTPTASIPAQELAPKAGGGGARAFAIVVSLLALLLAFLAVGLGVYASTQATAAKQKAEQALNGGVTPQTGPGQASSAPRQSPVQVAPTAAAPGPLPTELGVLDPKSVFSLKYAKQQLTIAADCNGYDHTRYFDIDEPRVGPNNQDADITFAGPCRGATATAEFYSTETARAPGNQTTPNECAELFRTAPLAPDAKNPVNRGDVFCVSTKAEAAMKAGQPRRIALIEIDATSTDGKITISITGWNSPS